MWGTFSHESPLPAQFRLDLAQVDTVERLVLLHEAMKIAIAYAPQKYNVHRVVTDLNGHSVDDFLKAVGERFTVSAATAPVKPERTGTFGMYVDGHWHHLTIRPDLAPTTDPVRRLDVSVLSDQLLGPILGITDLEVFALRSAARPRP